MPDLTPQAVADAIHALIRENDRLKRELAKAKKPNNQKKLTKREVESIRFQHRAGATQAAIAETYDINPATVSRIVRGQYHKGAA